MSKIPDLEELNTTELLQILSGPGHGRLRLSRATPRARLIQLVRECGEPDSKELSGSHKTRKRLQAWIHQNWGSIGSQIPCMGDRRGQCTRYPCTEGRHIGCYLAAKKHML